MPAGRKRSVPTDLPRKVHKKGNRYFYVHSWGQTRYWEPLSEDRQEAIRLGNKLNAASDEERRAILAKSYEISRQLREEVFNRDGPQCVYCGSTEALGIDHVIPHSRGGATLPFNLVVSCHSCNSRKGDAPNPAELILQIKGLLGEVLYPDLQDDCSNFD